MNSRVHNTGMREKSMNKISNKQGYKHQGISYPLINRRAVARWRGCHGLATGKLHKPGQEERDEEQSIHLDGNHLLRNN